MGYAHCHKHDEEATNGCESCAREYVVQRIEVLDDLIDRYLHPGWGAARVLAYLKEEGFAVIDIDTTVDFTEEMLSMESNDDTPKRKPNRNTYFWKRAYIAALPLAYARQRALCEKAGHAPDQHEPVAREAAAIADASVAELRQRRHK